MDRWGGEGGRGRGRGPPGPSPPPARWGPPGPERHQQPDRWGGPIAPEAGRRDKWDKWTPLEGEFECLVKHFLHVFQCCRLQCPCSGNTVGLPAAAYVALHLHTQIPHLVLLEWQVV